MKWLGSSLIGILVLALLGQMIAEGLLPVGAIAQTGAIRILNSLDAMRGQETEAVDVEGMPQFLGCEADADGEVSCRFE